MNAKQAIRSGFWLRLGHPIGRDENGQIACGRSQSGGEIPSMGAPCLNPANGFCVAEVLLMAAPLFAASKYV